MLKGFRQFLFRGNVIDLAVAVVIGAAFGGVVDALVKDLLTPVIAAIVGKPDFSGLVFTANNSKFLTVISSTPLLHSCSSGQRSISS
jgi:large conductance mechanosensitive channel